MIKTKYNKSVSWLEPFYDSAKDLLPRRKKLIAVKGFSVPLEKTEQIDGQCSSYGNEYVITVRTHNQIVRANANGTQTAYRHKARFIYDILLAFAHELAHLRHWDHTPEHWRLECRIIQRFIRELKKRQVKDVTTRRPKDLFRIT